MRHRRDVRNFSRKLDARKALMRGLVYALVERGRIKTTLSKAKELRRRVEKAITLGTKGSLHARRLLLARYPNQRVVATIMTDLAIRFAQKAGGYTRIIKIGSRVGDMAEMAFIEFIDYEPSQETQVDQTKVSSKKIIMIRRQHKKHLRKIQQRDRKILRAYHS